MTSEGARKMAALYEAIARGDMVQYKIGGKWVTVDSDKPLAINPNGYRVAKTRVRPYRDYTELIADYKRRHGITTAYMPPIWVKADVGAALVTSYNDNGVGFTGAYKTYEELATMSYADGGVCGITEVIDED